jgi:NADPH-dependent 2,4-dienoyl-CoA reductase/sulfur reductase-like enzyme
MSRRGKTGNEGRERTMIIVIGAGPAGLAAAEAASRNGTEVSLIDSSPRVGGQYWRNRGNVRGYRSARADQLFEKISSAASITHISEATVWSIEKVGELFRVNYLQRGLEGVLTAEKLIIATGAYDRSLPFPGWDQPGSMTPGAAQAMLKGNGVVVGRRVVVAGTGPFLLPVATGLAESGADVVGLFDANNPIRWLLSLHALLLNPEKFAELIYYGKLLKKYRITPQFNRVISSFGDGLATVSRLEAGFKLKKNTSEKLSVDVVSVGWGFLPDVTLGGIAGCAQKVDSDGTTIFAVDGDQRSSLDNIWIAGEATGIGGADLSLIEGEIAGLSASGQNISWRKKFTRFRKVAFANALKRSYPIGDDWKSWLQDSTTICRCEEVKMSEICESVSELGAEDSRTAKLFTRAGMGLCQGRVCSRNVSEIVADLTNCKVSDAERIASSNRPIASPISLGLLGDGKK